MKVEQEVINTRIKIKTCLSKTSLIRSNSTDNSKFQIRFTEPELHPVNKIDRRNTFVFCVPSALILMFSFEPITSNWSLVFFVSCFPLYFLPIIFIYRIIFFKWQFCYPIYAVLNSVAQISSLAINNKTCLYMHILAMLCLDRHCKNGTWMYTFDLLGLT